VAGEDQDGRCKDVVGSSHVSCDFVVQVFPESDLSTALGVAVAGCGGGLDLHGGVTYGRPRLHLLLLNSSFPFCDIVL
jgi:hypothetical protein